MKSAETNVLRLMSSGAAEAVDLAHNLTMGQLRLAEKKVIIARHFSAVNGSCVDADIRDFGSNKNALKQEVLVATNKVRQALDYINKGIERIDELQGAISKLVIKMTNTVVPEEPVGVSELEDLLADYENDNIFQYFKKKSKLSDSTSLSTGLNGVDKFVARVTGYETALENFVEISSEIQRRNSLPKNRSVSPVQQAISMKRKELKAVRDYMEKSLSKLDDLWLALLSKVANTKGKIENLDQELACLVAREMSVSSLRAGGVGNVKVPIMDEHDQLLTKVDGIAELFDIISKTTTEKISNLNELKIDND